MNAIVGYIKFILSNEQKKTDFNPVNEENIMIPLCSNVRYFSRDKSVRKEIIFSFQGLFDGYEIFNATIGIDSRFVGRR